MRTVREKSFQRLVQGGSRRTLLHRAFERAPSGAETLVRLRLRPLSDAPALQQLLKCLQVLDRVLTVSIVQLGQRVSAGEKGLTALDNLVDSTVAAPALSHFSRVAFVH